MIWGELMKKMRSLREYGGMDAQKTCISRPSWKSRLAVPLLVLALLSVSALAQDNSTDYSQQKSDYWYKRGLGSSGTSAFKDALQSYDKALQIDPKNADIWSAKAFALSSLSLSEHDPAKYNESLNAYDKAIELYDNALRANPQDANVWYYKGLALSNKADTLRDASALNISGYEQDATRYYEEAIRAYENATSINPKYLTAWKNEGNVLYSLGRYNESLQAYDKAIEIDPKYGLALFGKGLALYKLNKYNESVQAYDGALETLPKNTAIWYNKGNALISLGLYNSAIKCYDQAIKLNQSSAEAWHYKGVAFEKLGLDVEANASFAKAKDLGYRADSGSDFEGPSKI
jgi:tetratricopeptide (TPR) repeat protein